MYKFLFMAVSFLTVSSVAFSADGIDYNKPFDEIKDQISEFDQRHSLMPVEVKPVKNVTVSNSDNLLVVKNESSNKEKDKIKESDASKNENKDLLLNEKKGDVANESLNKEVADKVESDKVGADKVEANKKSESIKIEKDKIISEQKVTVEKTVKPVYVVPPAFPNEDKKAIEDAKMYLKQNPDLKLDFDKTSVANDSKTDLVKVDEKQDVKSEVKAEENLLPKEKAEEKNIVEKKESEEPFVLKEIPPKKYDGSDIIFSNVIEEKAGTMENHPLIINRNKVAEKKSGENLDSLQNVSGQGFESTAFVNQQKRLAPSEALVPVSAQTAQMAQPTQPTVQAKNVGNEEKVSTGSVAKDEPKLLLGGSMNVGSTPLKKEFASKSNVEKKSKPLTSVSEREKIINLIPEMEKDVLTAHIASYVTEETAKKGIEIWKEKYPLITILHPFIKYENVEGKGMFYRVFVKGDEAKLENLCNQMKSNSDWCNIIR